MNLKEKETKILDLCLEIARLAMKVSLEEKYHVFCSFSGHVKLFEVRVFYYTQDYSHYSAMKTVFNQEVWLNSEEAVVNLQKIASVIKSFSTEG